MTKPEQPKEYGFTEPIKVDLAPRPKVRREYLHPVTGEPLTGVVRVFGQDGALLAAMGLVDGVFELNLTGGTYRLVAEVNIDGVVRYQESTETLGRYV